MTERDGTLVYKKMGVVMKICDKCHFSMAAADFLSDERKTPSGKKICKTRSYCRFCSDKSNRNYRVAVNRGIRGKYYNIGAYIFTKRMMLRNWEVVGKVRCLSILSELIWHWSNIEGKSQKWDKVSNEVAIRGMISDLEKWTAFIDRTGRGREE
jgi:hypothetical protein